MQHDGGSSASGPPLSDEDYLRYLRGGDIRGPGSSPNDPASDPFEEYLRRGALGQTGGPGAGSGPPLGADPTLRYPPPPASGQPPSDHAATRFFAVPVAPADPDPTQRHPVRRYGNRYDDGPLDEPTEEIASAIRHPGAPTEPPGLAAGGPPSRHRIPPSPRPWPAPEPTWQPTIGHRAGVRRVKRRRSRWLRVLGWTGAFLGLLSIAVGGYAFYEYRKISSNIKRIDVLAPNDPSIKNPALQLAAENFLLIGSDTRAGPDAKYGGDLVAGQRSDTTILAHLSPDRQHATLISFPRDAWVTIPACTGPDGRVIPEHQQMFNTAFEVGGPQCTILTLQKLTGIEIKHYLQVDFTGFKTMVDALGGVPICATENVYDADSGLRLHPGMQTLQGEQALAFVRARHNLGDGSDLDRIKRQQQFLASMVRVASSKGILFNPIRLTDFLDAASKAVTLDRQTSLSDLRELASQLHGLDPHRVTFLTAPVANRDYDPTGKRSSGGGRVLLDAAQGQLLWQSIINDKPATAAGQRASPSASATNGTTGNTVTVLPQQVTVQVHNGVGTEGLATMVTTALADQGFRTLAPANTTVGETASVIRYAPEAKAAALTLAAAVPGSELVEDATLGATLQLVVGSSYHGVRPVQLGQQVLPAQAGPVATPSPQPSINAGQAGCV